MKIVVLDGHTLNPGDLSWAELQALGDCTIHPRTAPAEFLERARGAEVLITNKHPLTREQFAQLPELRYVGVTATGYNIVDIAAARERQIVVTNVPAYGTASVAQLTFALILELAHHVGHHAATVREGRWARSADWCYWDRPLLELAGLRLGIVGFGNIGRAVAIIGQAFGMEVMATSSNPAKCTAAGVRPVSLEDLFTQSDVVSLHCPLTPETKHLVNATRLAQMKTNAFLINTSRGPLVDEAALATALAKNQIAGAAVDVLSVEPPPATNPLLQAKNCLVTPHLAWATQAARQRLLRTSVANVAAFLAGRPQNVVT